MRDLDHSIRPLLSSAADKVFNQMVQLLQEKKNIPPEEIKFESAEAKEPQQWEISSWSALNLVPQSQSSAIEAAEQAASDPEDGEVNEDLENPEDELLDDLMHNLPDFYHLIPKRHLRK